MSQFCKDFEAFSKQNGFNIIRAVEVYNGISNEVTFCDTYRSLNTYSVSKAFVVTAVGLLYDASLLSPDEKLVNILKKHLCNINPEFEALTVDDALKHRMGLECGYLDIDVMHPSAYGTDFLNNVFSAPPVCPPGTKSIYTDAAFYVLARAVEERCGMPIENLLWEKLFTPMEFSEAAWSKCPMGHAMGATGLYISTRDMAKLGELYLNDGIFNGKQIISASWAEIVRSRGYELCPCSKNGSYGKGGMYGQMLIVNSKKHRVVAWHAFEHKSLSPLIDWVCNY